MRRDIGKGGTQLIGALAVVLSLTACGGGSSGGSFRNFTPPPGGQAPGGQVPGNNNNNNPPAPPAPNVAPSFDAVGDQTFNEDDTAQTITISTITAGSALEDATQLVTITASSSDPTIVPNPTITGTGPTRTFSLAPAADAFGSVTITLTAQDSGGTQNGGVDTFTQAFNVTVNSVNDAPSFDAIADQSVSTSAGPTDVAITNISGGPANESQTVTIVASSDNPTAVPNPTISGTGATQTLTFSPAGQGTANITVTAQDPDGVQNGGVDTFTQMFTITVANANQGSVDTFTPAAASNAGGTNIAISTSGFGDDFTVTPPTVTINGATAAFVSAPTATSVIVTVPNTTSGAATVVVTDSTSTAQSTTGLTIVDPVVTGDLVINEVFTNPNDGNGGVDANNDGNPSTTEDEFVEIVNTRSTPIDITGFTLADAVQTRHTFPNPTTIPANGALVIFGGGTPTGFATLHADGAAQAASNNQLGLNNGAGETVTISDLGATAVATTPALAASTGGVSFNRSTDADGAAAFDLHSNVAGNTGNLSPGLRVDGTLFSAGGGQQPGNASLDTVTPALSVNAGGTMITIATSGFADDLTVSNPTVMFGNTPAAAVSPVDPSTITVATPAVASGVVTITVTSGADTATFTTFQFVDPAVTGELIINEFLYDPNDGTTTLDANNDGTSSSTQDEFVEIVNTRATPVDITGFQINDAQGQKHVFPNPTTIPAGGAIVVFSGGTPTGFPPLHSSGAAQVSTNALSLGNGGDTISLLDVGGNTLDSETYSTGGDGVSRNRSTDGDGATAFDDHPNVVGSNSTRASPGTRVDGSSF